ncbi:PREDICTED: protein FAR1-RELATED SEQUENCE 5-like [Erythranthe guttata]|uniref:protein FAR1-RELATED SEQUENCE 5-like n=1 Tax=Erythranthe guttata TaxID=4155 RepID=UPI00064DC58C|nr:PREDICTED: protein FAR1-RELATED SEQUENCE 5-like [Erythranthe guttata]|eukprot:XP_012833257.1 PREDICTED: protein FAR1-RELATED SEQUENCE 5-like [Erythranthe guttata]
MSSETKYVLQLMTDVEMKPSHVIDFLDEACAGSETRLFNRKDAYNYLNGVRLKRIEGGDANTVLGLLNGMKVNDKSIEYQHSVDANNALTRIFWCDGISRAEYEHFGDVILFDSTYKTNIYRFPIVLLSGVNSHLCTCIFGVAIMYKETTQQYTWLLQTFQKFMNGIAPAAVLTDQDAAMCAAIRDVFPKATHRLCYWHISRNAETNIKIPGFSTCFSKLMKSTCSVAQFEARWSTLIAKFGVADHPWIQDIYSKRHLWAEAFFRGKFFSMMRSTQRAESMNASLKQKVSSGCSLTDLFRQYNNNFLKRIRKRFHVLQKESENPPREVKRTGLLSGLENHAGRVCTRAIFDYIQKELKEEANIIVLN